MSSESQSSNLIPHIPPHSDLKCVKCNTHLSTLLPSLPPTPVPGSFTHSGSAFSAVEVSSIREAVCTATEGIQNLDDRIAQLESFLSHCKNTRKSHTEFIRHHTSLLSFSRRLPAEIWGLVFEWAQLFTPLQISGIIFESANPRSMPMLATHVCRYWRRIAISTPKLWSNLHLRVSTSLPESKIHLVNAWLTRSSASPLTILVDVISASWSVVPQETKHRLPQTINILISHSSRWQVIDFRLWSEVYKSVAFPVSFAPLLEKVSITTRDFYLASSWYPIFFNRAPRLGSVTLENFLPALASFARMMPWEAVSNMRLGSGREGLHYTTSEALNILSIIPNLTDFGAGCMPDFDNSSEGEPVHHDALTNLSLRTGNSRLFQLLTAPSLTRLELSSFHSIDVDNIRSFISRCPNLRHLVLDDSNFSFIAGLKQTDCPIEVFELRLFTSDLSEGQLLAFSALAPIPPECPVLPLLKSIEIRLSFDRNGGGDAPVKSVQLLNAIVALTRRRSMGEVCSSSSSSCGVGSGLDTISVWVNGSNASEVTLEVFSNLKELGLDGLDLNIT